MSSDIRAQSGSLFWGIHTRASTAAFLSPALGVFGLFVLWPVLQVFWLALHHWDGYGPLRWAGMSNLGALWNDPQFHTALGHSILWEAAALIVPSVLALGLALCIGAGRLRHISLAVLFFPALLPPTAVAALWLLILSPLSGPLNSILRTVGLSPLAQNWLGDPHLALAALFVAWIWSSLGVSVLLFWAGLAAIGPEYRELALTEGAGSLWRLLHVTLPGLKRTLGVVLLVNAALGTEVFDLIFVTTGGGPGYATMTLPLDMYGRAFNGRTGEGAMVAALQVLFGIALAVMAVLLLRRGNDGLQTGEARPASAARGARGWAATSVVTVSLVILLTPLAWLLAAAVEPGRDFALGTGQLTNPASWTAANLAT
ncbi:MAG: hypothetical protein DLM70_17510, partial [Chloroflexi bacterium]